MADTSPHALDEIASILRLIDEAENYHRRMGEEPEAKAVQYISQCIRERVHLLPKYTLMPEPTAPEQDFIVARSYRELDQMND